VRLADTLERLRADPALRGTAFSDAWRAAVDPWLVTRSTACAAGAESAPKGSVALVAVGGYGRGDLAPGSDLDLLLLHADKEVPAALAEKLWYPIWDEGLKLGHAVRTGRGTRPGGDDLDTATSLLTCRHLAGDADLTEQLASEAAALWSKRAKRFLGLLRDTVAARQAQHGEVAFLLEPDLKEGRGGLRDIHALRWAQAARPVLEVGDAEALDAAERTLFGARVELHRATGRAERPPHPPGPGRRRRRARPVGRRAHGRGRPGRPHGGMDRR
jgi:[protein-PII] uridylyltransferase